MSRSIFIGLFGVINFKAFDYILEIHDIVKLKLNQSILNKKGKLSEDEYEHIKLHVNLGVQILRKYSISESVCKIVEQHHESEDGIGYPNRLKGDDNLIESKILPPYLDEIDEGEAKLHLGEHRMLSDSSKKFIHKDKILYIRCNTNLDLKNNLRFAIEQDFYYNYMNLKIYAKFIIAYLP